MSQRFLLQSPIAGGRAVLTGDEARHLSSVMRAQVGDTITLFDGRGCEFVGRVLVIRKHGVELEIVEQNLVSRELPFPLTLAVALPKGERQKWLVEKLTELGVSRLVPLITERGVAQPVESAIDRLRRTVIEASKQCGRNRLMEIAAPCEATEHFTSPPLGAPRIIADPTGRPARQLGQRYDAEVIAAIGPEGGFTPAEIAAATSAGWETVSLGQRTLRVETAAIAVAAWAAISHPSGQSRSCSPCPPPSP